jgi:hypothetical protein
MNKKSYDKLVEMLVPEANVLAISSFTDCLDRYSELKMVDLKEWDFFVTVAGLSVGLIGLADKVVSEDEYERLTNILSKKIKQWNSSGEYALGNLMSHMTKYRKEMMNLPPDEATKMWAAMLSSWCLVNLKMKVPKDKPSDLMIELGMFLIVSFKDWWNRNNN